MLLRRLRSIRRGSSQYRGKANRLLLLEPLEDRLLLARIDVELVALSSPSGSDTLTALPASETTVAAGNSYYVEVWVQQTEGSQGIQGGRVDIRFNPSAEASFEDLNHGAIYTALPSGAFVSPDLVNDFGGATFSSGVGVAPDWARLGYIKMRAETVATITYTLEQGNLPFGIANVGNVPWDDVDLDSITINAPEVEVDVAPPLVGEDSGSGLVYTFARTNVSSSSPSLTVNFAVGGRAVFTDDYSEAGAATFGATAGTVTFSVGASTATVIITPTSDTLVEGDEDVVLTVAAGTEYIVGTPDSATGTIEDGDTVDYPNVTTVAINGGSANRSGVAELRFDYDQAVTVSSATALRVHNHTSGNSINLSAATLLENGTSTITWDLSSVSLPDGRYTAELPAADATNAQGLPLAGTYTFEFSVLQGDVNGDAVVNFADYGAVGTNFDPLPGNAYRAGDANGDGRVNFADYGVIGANFNPLGIPALTYDLGDAPEASTNYPTTLDNGGAIHVIGSGLFLGASVDSEVDGQPHADALGDDNAGDDEDGVTFGGLTTGSNANITVVAAVPSSAVLNAWVDFNADGDWSDLGEQIFTNEPLGNGSNALSFSIPAAAAIGDTFARFRLSTSSGYNDTGIAPDGEVEDYKINIAAAAGASTGDGGQARPFAFVALPSSNGLLDVDNIALPNLDTANEDTLQPSEVLAAPAVSHADLFSRDRHGILRDIDPISVDAAFEDDPLLGELISR